MYNSWLCVTHCFTTICLTAYCLSNWPTVDFLFKSLIVSLTAYCMCEWLQYCWLSFSLTSGLTDSTVCLNDWLLTFCPNHQLFNWPLTVCLNDWRLTDCWQLSLLADWLWNGFFFCWLLVNSRFDCLYMYNVYLHACVFNKYKVYEVCNITYCAILHTYCFLIL